MIILHTILPHPSFKDMFLLRIDIKSI